MPIIVVGVDFSDQSHRAVEAAIRAAKDSKARLLLVHGLPRGPPGSPRAGRRDPITELERDTSVEQATETGNKWCAQARAAGVDAKVVLEEGPAAAALLRVAEDEAASLIVVGSHGRTGLRRAVLGSVADAVVRDAQVPVLIVP